MGRFTWVLEPGLELRLWGLEDAAPLARLVRRNQSRLARWLPFATPGYDVPDAEAFIRSTLRQYAEGQGLQCGIWTGGELAGAIGLRPIDWPNRVTAIGYWLDQGHEGQGIVTKAARALVDHAFGDLRLNRVEIRAEPDNLRSLAVAERLGFRAEGVLRQVVRWEGVRPVDHVVYAMLAEEWPPRTGAGGGG